MKGQFLKCRKCGKLVRRKKLCAHCTKQLAKEQEYIQQLRISNSNHFLTPDFDSIEIDGPVFKTSNRASRRIHK